MTTTGSVLTDAPAPPPTAVSTIPLSGERRSTTTAISDDVFVASPTTGAPRTAPPEYRRPVTVAQPLAKESPGDRRRRLGVPRRFTVRVVLFILLLLAVPAGAIAVVRWYALDNWYVAIDHGVLAVFQGRQGGFLGFEPKLLDLTKVTTSEVLPYRLPALRHTVDEPSLKAGEQYIANLHREFVAAQNPAPLGG